MPGGPSGWVWRRRAALTLCTAALLVLPLLLAQGSPSSGGTLDRIRVAGRIKLGYRTEARPFAYTDEGGQPAGYSVAVCRLIADAVRAEAGLSRTSVEWVPVTGGDRFSALQQGQVDLLCGAEAETLSRRTRAAFSIPVYPGGIGALVRADAPVKLREVLAGRGQTFHPTWRAAATQVLRARAFSAIQGTTADQWLTARIGDLQVIADISRVTGYNAGIQGLLDRKADVFFADRAVLLDHARRHMSARDLLVIDRLFTYEPLALAMAPGDEQFRLLADRTLSRLYNSGEIHGLYMKWFGAPDEATVTFFRWNALPE